jgi:hypothetical protein
LAELVGTKLLAWCLITLQRAKALVFDYCFHQFCTYSQLDGLVWKKLDGLVQEKKMAPQNALLNKSMVLNSKCPEHFSWGGVKM